MTVRKNLRTGVFEEHTLGSSKGKPRVPSRVSKYQPISVRESEVVAVPSSELDLGLLQQGLFVPSSISTDEVFDNISEVAAELVTEELPVLLDHPETPQEESLPVKKAGKKKPKKPAKPKKPC